MSLSPVWLQSYLKCGPILFESLRSELTFFSLHCSFSTAYQCIYYSPEHTAKAQEVLSTMSLLQPLITSLADQLLQAAQEHSTPGLRDALKNLSDKVRQPPNPSPTFTSLQTIPLSLLASSCCNTQTTSVILGHIAKHCQVIPPPEKPLRLISTCL